METMQKEKTQTVGAGDYGACTAAMPPWLLEDFVKKEQLGEGPRGAQLDLEICKTLHFLDPGLLPKLVCFHGSPKCGILQVGLRIR